MKRFLPILLIVLSACSNSRQACDAYDTGSGLAKSESASYRSVSSPNFSDSVSALQPAVQSMEEVAVKSKNTYKKENTTDKFTGAAVSSSSNQQQISTSSYQLEKLNASVSEQRTQRNPSVQDQLKMDEEVDLLDQLAPESFENNLYQYVAGNYDVTRINYLKKAEALNPQDKEVISQLTAHYLCMNDNVMALSYLKNWKKGLPTDQLDVVYATDVLLSVEENGVLIVHGIMDTYSALWQQLHNATRPDVQIISLELLQSQSYRNWLAEKGYSFPQSAIVDKAFLTQFCKMNGKRSISLAMTIPKEYLSGMTFQLFAVGLTFEYSDRTDYDNFYRNELLWNSKLRKDLINELEKSNATYSNKDQLVANYLPMLLQLRQVYVQKNEVNRIKEIDVVLDEIGKSTGKSELIEKIKQGQK
jgi:hypothetical protein